MLRVDDVDVLVEVEDDVVVVDEEVVVVEDEVVVVDDEVDEVVVIDVLVDVDVVDEDVDDEVLVVVVVEDEVVIEVEVLVVIVVDELVVVVKPVTSYSTKISKFERTAGEPVLVTTKAKTSFCFMIWLGIVAGGKALITEPTASLTVEPVSAVMSNGVSATIFLTAVLTGTALTPTGKLPLAGIITS